MPGRLRGFRASFSSPPPTTTHSSSHTSLDDDAHVAPIQSLFHYPDAVQAQHKPPPSPSPITRLKSGDAVGAGVSAMEHLNLKRHSLTAMAKGKGKDKDRDARAATPVTSAHAASVGAPRNRLDLAVESPPAVFYGNANSSTGALYAGQLRLDVADASVTLASFTMELVAVVTARKPVVRDCAACATQTTQLKQWSFISHPTAYARGQHSMPFSYLIPGHLPTTVLGELGRIQYHLYARATVQAPPGAAAIASADHVLEIRRELPISRAVKPLDEKTSLRIFPPTNLTARVTHNPIIHPIGDVNVQMHVNGILERQKDIQTRWRLRKLNWRLEELEKMISPACPKHVGKVGGEGKGIQHEEARTIGRGEIKSGWKTDLSDGSIELEFVVRPSGNPPPLCDVDSPTGLTVTHTLVVELIIAEEWAPNKAPEKSTPTGAARVLRMQFAMMVTERSGMGISWDEEQPPVYEDVPASPPIYPQDRSAGPAGFPLGGPPSYPTGVADPETLEVQRSLSQILNYTGTPLAEPGAGRSAPGAFDEAISEDELEGLSIGPARLGVAGASRARTSPSPRGEAAGGALGGASGNVAAADRPSSSRGRAALSADDLEAGG